ncbi:MAG: hypothetical protein SO292_04145 [Bacilli bacterium]|nr:hypothetical protein [Bacilli bacterium]
MTFTEILKAQDLTDEQIVKISTEMKSNKIFLASEENLDVRYNKLKLESEQNEQELEKSKALINELQKGNKGNEELQAKVKGYEAEIANLKKANEQQRVESALDKMLLESHVQDVDYVKFKIKEKGTELKIDEQGNLVGAKDMIDALKIQLPNQFSNSNQNSKIKEFKLPENQKPNDTGISKDQFNKMSYQERLKLFNENKEAFDELSKSDK